MKKYRIHVIPNSHTDLGYTHRQEYVYRSHTKYIDHLLEIIDKDKSFRWTLENFWMVENYKARSSAEHYQKLLDAIKNKNIEVSANYLNLLNIFDKEAYKHKIEKATKEIPNIKVAIQQDVNSFSKAQAMSLYDSGVKNIYASIHTHHGMFVGEGKQRGFRWKIDENKIVNVWGGEHYMLGNEMFMHNRKPNQYTFKDSIAKQIGSHLEQGLTRLRGYLDLLDKENYPYDSIPVVLSGTVIDNSPPNYEIIKAVKKINEEIGDRAEVFVSSLEDFFEDINTDKMPLFTGEWPSWWVDGINSTPEEVRQYREAQILYKNILSYNENVKAIDEDKIRSLEDRMLFFSEHTWGSWSSQHNPFANGNNLLLSRKRSMSTDASKIAWDLWDDIKELEGYNIVKITEGNKYVVKNPHKENISKVIALEPPRSDFGELEYDRYVNHEDAFEIVNEKDEVVKSTLSDKMGLDDNINTSIEGSKVILVKVKLNPLEKKTFKIRRKVFKYKTHTSSYKNIGVDNADDVKYAHKDECKYLRNGIESTKYVIKWNKKGIYSIYDKTHKKELMLEGKTIKPIRIISENDSRIVFGRNRQGPSARVSNGELVSHTLLTNKNNIQIVKLIFKMDGSIKTELNIRITNLDKKIRLELLLHKTGTQFAENIYLDLPLVKDNITGNNETNNFVIGKDQLPKTNLDYFSIFNGLQLNNKDLDINIYSQDVPLFNAGPLNYQQRFLKDVDKGEEKQPYNPSLWIMGNYWETNYKGTLEGTYSFALDIESSPKNLSRNKMEINHKKLIGFKVWKK